MGSASEAVRVRRPAVAGSFYPADPETLRAEVARLLHAARADNPGVMDSRDAPKAIIAPHAGYMYSGPVAASAYAPVSSSAPGIRRVVLVGPSHFVPLTGLALPDADALETPLGRVALDPEARERLARRSEVCTSARAHAFEHSLEVQLPFLQYLLGEFTVVPLAAGDASPDEVADVLEDVWGNNETLLVISTDLSHYLPYEAARRVDSGTCQLVMKLEPQLDGERACGYVSLNGMLLTARRRGLRIAQLDLRNSGDTAGDRTRVVGYGAFAIYE